MMPQSPSKQVPWDLTQLSQLQHDIPSTPVAEAMEQILPRHVSCQDPASKSRTQQFLESPDQLLVLALSVTNFCYCSLYTCNILRCLACCRSSRMWITVNRFSTIFEASVPHFYLCCTHCIVPKSLLDHPNSFCREMFKLNAKFGAGSLLSSLSHLNVTATRTHAHCTASNAPTDQYSEVILVYTCAFQSTRLGCSVTQMQRKPITLC